jgi:hypothetical protein
MGGNCHISSRTVISVHYKTIIVINPEVCLHVLLSDAKLVHTINICARYFLNMQQPVAGKGTSMVGTNTQLISQCKGSKRVLQRV